MLRTGASAVAAALLACAWAVAVSHADAPAAPEAPDAPEATRAAAAQTTADETGAVVGAAMEVELSQLGLAPKCQALPAGARRCDFDARSSLTERKFEAHAQVRPDSRTVELWIAPYLRARPEHPGTPALMLRLMELNATLLGAHFAWDPTRGEVRLAAVMHCDSSFDRRAFRSLVHTLDRVGARYHRELSELLQTDAAPAKR